MQVERVAQVERRSTIRSSRLTSCGRERCPRGIFSIQRTSTLCPGSKHYSVLSSLLLSEPRMSGTFTNTSKIARHFPLRPLFVSKFSYRETPSITPGPQISNSNIFGAANERSKGERGSASKCLISSIRQVSNMEQRGTRIRHREQECLNMPISRKENLILNMFINPKSVMEPKN